MRLYDCCQDMVRFVELTHGNPSTFRWCPWCGTSLVLHTIPPKVIPVCQPCLEGVKHLHPLIPAPKGL